MYSCVCLNCHKQFTADDKREPMCFPCVREANRQKTELIRELEDQNTTLQFRLANVQKKLEEAQRAATA